MLIKVRHVALLLVTLSPLAGCRERPVGGHGDEPERQTPERTASSGPAATAPGPLDALALGGRHSCGRLRDGAGVVCWGGNELGQVGTPVPQSAVCANAYLESPCVPGPQAVAVTDPIHAIALGTATSCVIAGPARGVWCWGAGPVGFATARMCPHLPAAVPCQDQPGELPSLQGARALAVGGGHGCAALADGRVACWGANSDGQLGSAPSETLAIEPVEVAGLEGVVALAAGDRHSCALLEDRRVTCWGADDQGQLGRGVAGQSPAPAVVEGLPGLAQVLALGRQHSCALLEVAAGATEVWCWGSSERGQLGDGQFVSSARPIKVAGLEGAVALAAGEQHTCALLAGGRARCWGAGDQGQLGDGGLDDRGSPVEVAGLSRATALGAGRQHTCALVGDAGEAWCWGANALSQLGRATPRDASEQAAPVVWSR